MAISFPSSPINGQTYSSGYATYTYVSASNSWIMSTTAGVAGADIKILGTTASVSTTTGALTVAGGVGVGGSVVVGGKVSVGSSISAGSTVLQAQGANGLTNAGAIFGVLKTAENYGLYMGIQGTGNSWLQSGTFNDATYYTLTLNPNGGNVGIGTASPVQKLDVFGDGAYLAQRASTTSQAGGGVWSQASTFWSSPTYMGTGIQSFGSAAAGTTAGISNASLNLLTLQNSNNSLIYTNNAAPIIIATTSIERLRITADGGLSFGVTGSAYGTSGQVLQSNGNAPPTWVTPSGGGATLSATTVASVFPVPFAATTSGSYTVAYNNPSLYFNPGTTTLYSGVFQSLSDERQKSNISVISNGLEIVENLRGVTFDWVNTPGSSAGLIAQDVERWLPQLVSTDANGIKNLNYSGVR